VSQSIRYFAPPKPGDIVWCRFPQEKSLQPAPKARPTLVLRVGEIDGHPAVAIAYGTSQKLERLFPSEFAILPADGAAYTASIRRFKCRKMSIAGRPPIPAAEIKSLALNETELAAVLGVLDVPEPSATQGNNRSQKGSGPG